MSDVKRYDPINSDGTCGMCIEDADYGAYVEYADYAALEAELAKLRAGQEPVAWISWTNEDPEWKLKMLAEPVHPPVVPLKLYTAPQPNAVPDDPVENDAFLPGSLADLLFQLGEKGIGVSGGTHGDRWQVRLPQPVAAPSTPATVQGVNQQLLEALENTATWIEQLPVPTVGAAGQLVKIDKAIAAARKGEQ